MRCPRARKKLGSRSVDRPRGTLGVAVMGLLQGPGA